MKTKIIFTGLIGLWIMGLTAVSSLAQFKVVGYMPSWAGTASQIQYGKLTHINYAFALPRADGSIKPIDNVAKLQSIVSSAHANGVKVLMAVGGWSDAGVVLDPTFETLAANAGSRTTFVNSCISLVNTYNLDGIDIDWEYPDAGASSNNFHALMSQLGTELRSRGKLLTAAVIGNGSTGAGVPASVFSIVDWLNIMAYDANNFDHSTYSYATQCVSYWKGRGLPANKLVLGVPFYGRPSWESYATLVGRGADPYADVFQGVGYNGITTIKSKTQYAIDQAGGIMMWELSQDLGNQNSLLTAINQVVVANGTPNQAPSVSITSPANGSSFNTGTNITINANASDSDGSVTKVEFFHGTVKIGEDLTAPYSIVWSNAAAGSYTLTAKATDNKNASTTSSGINITVNTPATQSPYGGSPTNIPGKIEAERYDLGGQGVAFSDNTSGNSGSSFRSDDVDVEACTDAGGGFNVGWVASGEWLEYTVNVTSSGNYNFAMRVASIHSGKFFHIEMDGQNVTGSINVPNTGGWQTWQSVSKNNIALTAGQKVMRIYMDADLFNINYVDITSAGSNNQAPSVNITAPSNGSSFTAGSNIVISASASDPDGSISKVEFYNGATKLGEDASAPYNFTWNSVSAGTYHLTAKAFDNQNASKTSSIVSITVTQGGTGTCGLPAWSSSAVYWNGDQISYNGKKYQAKWWTQNQNPEQNSGAWDVWQLLGSCSAARNASYNFIEEAQEVSVSPNPVAESAYIEGTFGETSVINLSVINTNGIEVLTLNLPAQNGQVNTNINFSTLSPGIYTLKFSDNNSIWSKRIIVFR